MLPSRPCNVARGLRGAHSPYASQFLPDLRDASRRSFHDERIAAARTVVDPDTLGLEIAVDRLGAILPTEARSLVAAERHQETHGPIGIDPHGTGLDAFRHYVRPLDRLRPHARAQPIGDV